MEGIDDQSRQALHYQRFRLLKMTETPGQDPALDFDRFVSNIKSAQRFAAASGAPFTPVQVFDQLKQGIPRQYMKDLVNDITAGNNTMATLVPVFRLRLTTEYNLGLRSGSSAAAQAEAHTRNEKSTVQSLLVSVLKEADGKSDEEIRAMVLQQIRERPDNRGSSNEGGKAGGGKRTRSITPQAGSQSSSSSASEPNQLKQLKAQNEKLKQQVRDLQGLGGANDGGGRGGGGRGGRGHGGHL